VNSPERSVPKLRFPEFTGEWADKPLSDLISSLDAGVSVNSGDRPARGAEKGILKTSCVTNGVFDPHENKVVVDQEEIERLSEPVQAGTILISRMNTPALVGANAYVPDNWQNLYLPDRLWAAKVKKGISAQWLAQKLGHPQTRRRLSDLSSGTSGTMKNISKRDVLSLAFPVPDPPEQKKIAFFLAEVDSKIALLTRRGNALLLYRREISRRLFIRDLRFRRDDGSNFPNWRQGQLGDVFEERSERGDVDLPLLTVSQEKGIVPHDAKSRRDSSSEDKSSYKRVRPGDIAYNTMRMWQGACGVSSLDGIVSPAYTVIAPRENNSAPYWNARFKTPEMLHLFARYSQGLTSDTWNLKFPLFSRIPVMIPEPAEQQKIGEYIGHIDDKITANRLQVAGMWAFKKGLLQQMFV
jgi:type I restriction enzyme S subunit